MNMNPIIIILIDILALLVGAVAGYFFHRYQVDRAAIGSGQALGGHQNACEQAVDVALRGKRHANGVELFQPG